MMNNGYPRLFLLLLTNAIFFSSVYADQSVSYETVGNLRMKALGLSMTDEQKREEVKDVKLALKIYVPEDQKRRLIYQLLIQSEKRHGIDASCDDESLKTVLMDLDIVGSLLDKINLVQTYMGEATLVKMLASPLTHDAVQAEQNKDQLSNRQAFIKLLVDNPELLAQCDELLQQIKINQDNVLSYWNEEAPLTQKLINNLYYGKLVPAVFNKSTAMLELGTRLNDVKTSFGLCGDIVFFGLINYAAAKILHKVNKDLPALTVKEAALAGVQIYNPYGALKELSNLDNPEMVVQREQQARAFCCQNMIVPSEMGSDIDSPEMIAQREKINAMINEKVQRTAETLRRTQSISLKLSVALNTMFLGLKVVSCKNVLANAAQLRGTANYLQERLIGVSAYVRAIDQLGTLAQQHPELAAGLASLPAGLELFNANNDELHQLVKLLMTNTFKGQASFFSRTGRVLAAHSLMQAVKDPLFDSFQCLGELDACVAVAHLYKQYENERVGYTFAQMIAQDEPYICAVDFWNPVVNPAAVVTNSMELGSPRVAHHMILTGSNKGGKSTLLKAMMINALLAQTITIVPAKQFTATSFDCLMTYLNVTDNTLEGQSLFAAQVARTKKIVQAVDALKKGNRAFIVIDEIFTGTGTTNASKAACKVVNHMSVSPSACFIIATHFVDTLPLLEKTTKGRCKNFKFDADKDEQGNIVFRYKLEEGVSTTNIANDILGQEMSDIDFSSELGDL